MLRSTVSQAVVFGSEPSPTGARAAIWQLRWQAELNWLLATFPLPEKQGGLEGLIEKLDQPGKH